MKRAIFSDRFQGKASWQSFLDDNLGDTVSGKLCKPASEWSVQTFQALFVAAWIHHPTEKGSYTIDLSGLTTEQLGEVRKAYEEHCSPRISSHLGGAGRSASKGWSFLNGYKELLVQMETIEGRPCLFLKSEGHTTGFRGVIPHTVSYFHKMRTGEGMNASPMLGALSKAAPRFVEPRAAENYSKDYGKLLKSLGLKGRMVTAREMTLELFRKTGYIPEGQDDGSSFAKGATNRELGEALSAYCDAATTVGPGDLKYRGPDNMVTGKMIADLREVAKSLIDDGDTHRGRVHREIAMTPAELDKSLIDFGGTSAIEPRPTQTAPPARRQVGIAATSSGTNEHANASSDAIENHDDALAFQQEFGYLPPLIK
ncbi:hypothetical protein L2Y90_21845 [Burkholderia pyrrocinia]|uniref:hypothetical protein n=1 Tax=Burkholderia pyrrocinia TaxID=60550 RepID=UPI00215B529C|nr:hypothetical protein [Burkholderia pyrrocinia]UVE69372.1 hypothetical protein L2Y90_21845 [Burkholderia pyrrocinia]